jgi:hypothetical protein
MRKKRAWRISLVACLATLGVLGQDSPASAELPPLVCRYEPGFPANSAATCVANQGGYQWAAFRNAEPLGSKLHLAFRGWIELAYFPPGQWPFGNYQVIASSYFYDGDLPPSTNIETNRVAHWHAGVYCARRYYSANNVAWGVCAST